MSLCHESLAAAVTVVWVLCFLWTWMNTVARLFKKMSCQHIRPTDRPTDCPPGAGWIYILKLPINRQAAFTIMYTGWNVQALLKPVLTNKQETQSVAVVDQVVGVSLRGADQAHRESAISDQHINSLAGPCAQASVQRPQPSLTNARLAAEGKLPMDNVMITYAISHICLALLMWGCWILLTRCVASKSGRVGERVSNICLWTFDHNTHQHAVMNYYAMLVCTFARFLPFSATIIFWRRATHILQAGCPPSSSLMAPRAFCLAQTCWVHLLRFNPTNHQQGDVQIAASTSPHAQVKPQLSCEKSGGAPPPAP